MTLEELELGFQRVRAAQECRNLMGRYCFLHTRHRHRDYLKLWSRRDDCILEMPWGKYSGREGVEICYLEDHGDVSDPAYVARKHGEMAVHTMDTPVVEVAADGKTARGVWFNPGHETYYDETDERWHCDWTWGKYAVDFILEDGEWKFWHMKLYPVFRTDFSLCWCEDGQEDVSELADSLGFTKCTPYEEPLWEYAKDAIYPADQPEPPQPYERFEDVGVRL